MRAIRQAAKRLYNGSVNTILRSGPYHLEKIGTDYGGWIVPTDLMDLDWIVYSVGSGDDISFDLGVVQRFHCRVHAFDPTALSKALVAKVASGVAGFHFHPYGIWREDGRVPFYEPKDPMKVSHSITNIQGSDKADTIEVKSLRSVMESLNHDRIDLLKLDIEGAEYAVLEDALSQGIDIKVICVELDRPVPWREGLSASWGVLSRYGLVAVDGKNCTLIRRDLLAR